MASGATVDLTPMFEPLEAADLGEDVPAGLAAMAAASAPLVHDVGQMLHFAKHCIADDVGCTILWLQTRPKYGAPCTAVLSRQIVEGGSPPQDFARRGMRLLDPRPGAYSLRAPKKTEPGVADDDGLIPADMSTAALYATTNPRDARLAATATTGDYSAVVAEEARRLAAAAETGSAGRGTHGRQHRLDKLFAASLQREDSVRGRRRWSTLDVDDKAAVGPCMSMLDEAGVEVETAVETRGGVHLLIRPAAIGRAMRGLAPRLAALRVTVTTADGRKEEHEAVEVKADCGCPVPGTMQGGFPVRFVDPARLPRA